MAQFVEIYNYDERYESIRVDLIESVCKPSGRVHDYGSVVLIGGRRIAFGQHQEAERLLKKLEQLSASAPPAAE